MALFLGIVFRVRIFKSIIVYNMRCYLITFVLLWDSIRC